MEIVLKILMCTIEVNLKANLNLFHPKSYEIKLNVQSYSYSIQLNLRKYRDRKRTLEKQN